MSRGRDPSGGALPVSAGGRHRAPHDGRTNVAGWVVAVALGVGTLGMVPSAVPQASFADPGPGPVVGPTSADPTGLVLDEPAVSTPPAPDAPAASEPPTSAAPIVYRPAAFTTTAPDERARVAVGTAMAQLGLPYVWGGNGPTNGDDGFDCSGLTTFSYAAAGLRLPRTAHTQYYAGPHVPAGDPLQPGDLVFYGTPARVHHVGMYIGASRMINAPTFGQPVRTAYYRWLGDDYLGATRPAATGRPSTGLLPYLPPVPAPTTPAPRIFEAPPAPPAPPAQPGDPAPPEADSAAAAIVAADPRALAPAAPGTTVTPTTGAGLGTTTPGMPDPATPTTVAQGPGPQLTTPQLTTPQLTTPPVDAATGTAPPSTTARSTPPSTTPPTPPSATPPTPPSSSSTPPSGPTPTTRAVPTLTLDGTAVPVASVQPGADGLPARAGVWARPARPVARLGPTAPTAGPGSTVTLRWSDGSTGTYAVRSQAAATTAQAAEFVRLAPSGRLIVLVPAGAGRWTVLVAA